MKIGKVWGETCPWLITPLVEIHRVSAKGGGFSSRHVHAYKWNAFYVISGTLKIVVWKNDYNLTDETVLNDDEMTTVRPGEEHKFEAVTDCEFLEIYYLEPILGDDIKRADHGGL